MACEASFYLKNLKFTCLEIFLSYLGSSVKTIVHFFAVTRRLRRELPNFTFHRQREHTGDDKFLFLFANLNLLQESVPTLDKVSELG